MELLELSLSVRHRRVLQPAGKQADDTLIRGAAKVSEEEELQHKK